MLILTIIGILCSAILSVWGMYATLNFIFGEQ